MCGGALHVCLDTTYLPGAWGGGVRERWIPWDRRYRWCVCVWQGRGGERMQTFHHPSPSWTRSRRAGDTALPFSPSPSGASAAASGSLPSCAAPPPSTGPSSRNLKSHSSQLNRGLCNHYPTCGTLLPPSGSPGLKINPWRQSSQVSYS